MSKTKAAIIDTLIMLLMIGVIYMCWEHAVRMFMVFAMIFAAYGFLWFGVVLFRWLTEPPKQPESKRALHLKVNEPPVPEPDIPDCLVDSMYANTEEKT